MQGSGLVRLDTYKDRADKDKSQTGHIQRQIRLGQIKHKRGRQQIRKEHTIKTNNRQIED